MSLKVSYFGIRGLAEPIRMLLVDNGVDFEDHRFTREEWVKIKPTMIFHQVPALYHGNQVIVQTGAILRHLGRLYGLNGNNETEATYIDMFYEGIRDLDWKYVRMIHEEYETGKDKYINETLPVELAKLEKLFRTHNNGEQYIIGEKISFADYVLFEELDIHLVLTPNALDSTPVLKKFHERFAQRPNLQEYLKQRAILNPKINGNGKQ